MRNTDFIFGNFCESSEQNFGAEIRISTLKIINGLEAMHACIWRRDANFVTACWNGVAAELEK